MTGSASFRPVINVLAPLRINWVPSSKRRVVGVMPARRLILRRLPRSTDRAVNGQLVVSTGGQVKVSTPCGSSGVGWGFSFRRDVDGGGNGADFMIDRK